jgi:hypothetical protein
MSLHSRLVRAAASPAAWLALVFALLPWLAVPAAAEEVKVALEAKGGKAAGGIKVVRLKRDDQVSLSIVSDRADEVHVHGYDLRLELEPHQPGTLQFVARRTGRFAIELHKGSAEIGVLEIYPK